MKQIDLLQKENRDKALKIVELENIIRKQVGQLRQGEMKIQSLQILLKQRTQKINRLNVDFFRMEEEVIEFRKIKASFVEQQSRINELEQIIRLQGEQIGDYMRDQETYMRFVQQMYHSNQGWFEERGLLYEYRGQLQRQVNQVQEINEVLISRSEECQGELHQQNEQGNDLVGQIQYMIECCEGVQ